MYSTVIKSNKGHIPKINICDPPPVKRDLNINGLFWLTDLSNQLQKGGMLALNLRKDCHLSQDTWHNAVVICRLG